MASAVQLKALLESHKEGDETRFNSIAMQIAANKARRGHVKLAQELRNLIDQNKKRNGMASTKQREKFIDELSTVLVSQETNSRLIDMVLDKHLKVQIDRFIREQRNASLLLGHGLSPRRKLLLVGPPGTGKTLTASVLAKELGLPLHLVRFDGLMTKFLGETAAKLRQIFDAMGNYHGVYLFDEFDAIGSKRNLGNDVGEIRRILNSFLLMIEQDSSHSIIIAATNHPDMLDMALFRRFDDILYYEMPNKKQIVQLLSKRLDMHSDSKIKWDGIADLAAGLSYADLDKAATESIKNSLINGKTKITEKDLTQVIKELIRISDRLSKKR